VTQAASNRAGAAWMLASAACFTLEASFIKALGADYAPGFILFWRQLISVLILAPFVARDWRAVLATPRPGLMVLRSTIGMIGILLAIIAYASIPLADANALSFTRTLWIVLLAVLVLREPFGLKRIVTALVGFAGVVVMLQPGATQPAMIAPYLAALGAAFATALTILTVKVLARDHSVLTLTTYAAGLGLILSVPLAVPVWTPLALPDVPMLIGLGIAGLTTLYCYTQGMQQGDAALMAPIDYSRLVLAAVAGWLVFGETLTITTIIGAAIIVASAVLLTTGVIDRSFGRDRAERKALD
jgi:drug/metabolite transporter (DMT)-like permease